MDTPLAVIGFAVWTRNLPHVANCRDHRKINE
jgi:hypothetical protein